MIAPSDVFRPQIYADLDPEAIAHYLVANGWKCIHEEDGKFLGIRWFRHPQPQRWPNRELITNRTIPFALAHLFDTSALETLIDGGTILRVGAKRFRDYPLMNRHVLLDIEAHENRWIGCIISDIHHLEAVLSAQVAA
jgi:hypothetical protein